MSDKKQKVVVPKPARQPTIVNLVYSSTFEATRNGKALVTFPFDKLSPVGGMFAINSKPCMPLNALREILFGHTVRSDSSASTGSGLGFSSVIAHFRNPKSTIHIYHNGEFIICGIHSLEECLFTINMISIHVYEATGGLEGGGIKLRYKGSKLRNVVMAYATGYLIDLKRIEEEFGIDCRYAPELYKGLPYYPRNPDKTPCIVFHHTGAINVVGAESVQEGVEELRKVGISRFAVTPPPPTPPPPPPSSSSHPTISSNYVIREPTSRKRIVS